MIEAFLEAAKRYARGGYDVIVDGIICPWFLQPWLNIVHEGYEVHYIILRASKEETLNSIGRTFEPDFLLFCKQKDGKKLSFQVFIEPKGGHLSAKDKWKEDLLKAMKEKRIVVKDLDNYIITGVPFYNYDNENEFKKELNETLRTII